MLPVSITEMRTASQYFRQDIDRQSQEEREYSRRHSRAGTGDRHRRGRRYHDEDEDHKQQRRSSSRDREPRDGPDDRGGSNRSWTAPSASGSPASSSPAVVPSLSTSVADPVQVWDLQPSSTLEHQLQERSRQLQLQQQVAAAAVAAAAVSQPQLLLQLPQQFLLNSAAAAAAVDHMTLVNMNLAAAALQQQQQSAAAAAVVAAAAGANNTAVTASDALLATSCSESSGYRNGVQQQPNNTIMVRGLPSHINENDLRQEIIACNLVPRDIRLIRRKDSGASRGFAFIEFSTVHEAARWMELKQGVLLLQDQYRAVIQYSASRDSSQLSNTSSSSRLMLQDWLCPRCGGHNFKRRDSCYKCQTRRPECSDGASSSSMSDGDGSDEVSSHPTNTLLVRRLPADCCEEQLLTALQPRTQLPIRSVRLARAADTGASLRRCYLELNSVLDAMQLNKQLNDEPLVVGERAVSVCYCRLNGGSERGVADTVDTSRMSIQEMAEYSAKMYAKTPDEYQSYLQYYTDYYKTHGTAGVSLSQNQCDSANAAAAVAQTALQRVLKKTPAAHKNDSSASASASGCPQSDDNSATAAVFDENAVYPAPDTSTFQYDESSGYYFDSTTGLYYDSNSQYFYNGHTQTYLYWDSEQSRYIAAAATDDQQANDDKKKKEDKHEKVKVAKKIAKDMERWAKTMNNKKDATASSRSANVASAQPVLPVDEAHRTERNARAAADIGYAMFGKRGADPTITGSDGAAAVLHSANASALSSKNSGSAPGLVAAYGGESGDEEEHASNSATTDAAKYVDLKKLACLLCKRAFNSQEQLNKHLTKSELHRANLATLNKTAAPVANESTATVYRDRAAERRFKHGDPAPPTGQQRRRPVPSSSSSSAAAAPPVSGVGSRMMQAMGWRDGQGLGRDNQGRKEIVEAGRRTACAGLGAAGSDMGGSVVGDTYRDCVKKTMISRFNGLS